MSTALQHAVDDLSSANDAITRACVLLTQAHAAYENYASRLNTGGFRKAATSIRGACDVLRKDVTGNLNLAGIQATELVNLLSAADTSDLDKAEAALNQSLDALSELGLVVAKAVIELGQTNGLLAQIGTRSEPLIGLLTPVDELLDQTKGCQRSAGDAIQQAIVAIEQQRHNDDDHNEPKLIPSKPQHAEQKEPAHSGLDHSRPLQVSKITLKNLWNTTDL